MAKNPVGRPPQLTYAEILSIRELRQREGSGRPTLQQLAEEYGVSHMTVKRVAEMSPETLRRRRERELSNRRETIVHEKD